MNRTHQGPDVLAAGALEITVHHNEILSDLGNDNAGKESYDAAVVRGKICSEGLGRAGDYGFAGNKNYNFCVTYDVGIGGDIDDAPLGDYMSAGYLAVVNYV